MGLGGVALKFGQTTLRAIQFLASVLILGIFAYFLAVLSDHNQPIRTWIKAVEGMSGAAALYAAFAVVLTCFLGGIAFFAFLAIVLDVCFVGCFVAIAILTRKATHSCSGTVNTPLGTGPANSNDPAYKTSNFGFHTHKSNYSPDLKLACKLEKAVFAVAIVNIVLFIISALLQLVLGKHHQKEKRFGPSPANNYTAGPARRPFWKRNKKAPKTTKDAYGTDAELGTIGAGGATADKRYSNYGRPSHDTAYTGSTMAAPDPGYAAGGNKYSSELPATQAGTQGGYFTSPTTHAGPNYDSKGHTNF